VWKYIIRKFTEWFSVDSEIKRLDKLYEKAFIAIHSSTNWAQLQAAHKLLVALEKESNFLKDLTFQTKVDRLKLQWLNKYRNWKRFL
jgi:hypothetical protein